MQGRKRTSSAGRELRDDLRLHLSGSPKGRAVVALSHASSQSRRPRRSRPSQDTIKDRVSIHERPKTVDGRTEGGHWEGDLIICKRTRPVLVLHERKSRVTLAARLVDYAAGCLARSTSTKCPTKKFRTLSSPPISRPESAWASKLLFQAILKELGKDVQIRFA